MIFSNAFVDHIAIGNWSKFRYTTRAFYFWNKSNQGVVHIFQKLLIKKEVLNSKNYIITYDLPGFFVERRTNQSGLGDLSTGIEKRVCLISSALTGLNNSTCWSELRQGT